MALLVPPPSPLYRQPLASFPSTSACVKAIEDLHRAYKATFKRNATVALLCSTTCGREPDLGAGIKGTPDTFAIVLMATDRGAQQAEIGWFEAATVAFKTVSATASSTP